MFNWITKPFSILRAFFPVQILFGQLKYNLISLFYWSFLFMIVSESFGRAFGIPLLFFSPEYLGEISVWSFALLGFAIGGFTMAFNTYSYIKLGPRYPFLATVSRPFFKFCINNTLVPALFVLYYLKKMTTFQLEQEFASSMQVATYVFGFLGGFSGFMLLSIFYFFPTTREKGDRHTSEETSNSPIRSVTQSKEKWYNYFRSEKEQHYYYIGKHLKIYQSRSTKHLDRSIIEQVFAQNRINASIFEIITITAFIVSGQFIDYSIFEFPAAMSIVLLLTILHMIFSALMSWFHRWTYPILFATIYLLNYLSLNTPFFNYTNFAYGLNYEKDEVQKYNLREIQRNYLDQKQYDHSRKNMNKILVNWKKRTGEDKPKLIILTTSGGGSRSALWTFKVLQYCDKYLHDELSEHLNMITGASGGMVGAAYYRELLLLKKSGKIKDLQSDCYSVNLGKDLLNKLSFSVSTKDLFYRFQKFTYNGYRYPVDRGYAFEQQLNENTKGILDHPLGYYDQPEKRAEIPLMILTPTIVNDGRRLYISSQSLRFMTETQPVNSEIHTSFENIDYQSFFKENEPQKLRFISALRTSATFPFIMPMVTLPTNPEMQLMDAGIRDNYGIKTALNYLYANQDWIQKNTSGVILLSIRDTKKVLKNEYYHQISLNDKLTLPFGNMYSNFPRTQDFDQEQYLKMALSSFPSPVSMVTFNLRENQKDKISLSWHLTQQEKKKIKNALNSRKNQKALRKLQSLLND
jgi:hypothetical protein